MLRDPESAGEAAAYSFRRARPPELGLSVRTIRYRYTEWPDGSRELYDHYLDPLGRRNVATAPGYGRVMERMSRRLSERLADAEPTAASQ